MHQLEIVLNEVEHSLNALTSRFFDRAVSEVEFLELSTQLVMAQEVLSTYKKEMVTKAKDVNINLLERSIQLSKETVALCKNGVAHE